MSGSSLSVFEAQLADRQAWEAFTASAPHAEAGHEWGFHQLLERGFGQRAIRLVARRDGVWLGVLPLVHQKSLLGSFLTSVPYLNYAGTLSVHPEARQALATTALALARELRADRLELRGRDGSDLPIPTWEGKASYELDLAGTTDALWQALGSKVRSQIKRPSKEGYAARSCGRDGRRIFHDLLARKWHELGSPILPEAFFERLEEHFGDRLEYAIVETSNTVAAAGVLLQSRSRVEIPWAASARDHDRFGVNMLLYWHALERAIARGAQVFDFGRSSPGTGNAHFKLQWGAVERPLHWNVHLGAAGGRAAERGDSRRERAAAAWRRLPRFFVDRVGPMLARRIPY